MGNKLQETKYGMTSNKNESTHTVVNTYKLLQKLTGMIVEEKKNGNWQEVANKQQQQ